jgi:hypothetical protein
VSPESLNRERTGQKITAAATDCIGRNLQKKKLQTDRTKLEYGDMILLMMPVRNEIPLSDDNLMNHAAVRDSKKKTSTFFNIYNEQDNKNKPLLQTLNERQQNILASVGDSLNDAVDFNIDTVVYDATKILYESLDTTVAFVTYNKVFRYSTNPKKAFYKLTPGKQRAYLIHFTGAKQSATRTSRIEKYTPQILCGKGFYDCTCGLSKKMPICDGSHKFAR